jgi:hypothetical protein
VSHRLASRSPGGAGGDSEVLDEGGEQQGGSFSAIGVGGEAKSLSPGRLVDDRWMIRTEVITDER